MGQNDVDAEERGVADVEQKRSPERIIFNKKRIKTPVI